MNKILNKVSKRISHNKERLSYPSSDLSDKDYMMISKNTVFRKVKNLLEKDKTVICNLTDRYGKIGQPIVDITSNFTNGICVIKVKSGIEKKLHDRYLYNIIYSVKKNKYSLEEHDEYYEKIESKNDFK